FSVPLEVLVLLSLPGSVLALLEPFVGSLALRLPAVLGRSANWRCPQSGLDTSVALALAGRLVYYEFSALAGERVTHRPELTSLVAGVQSVAAVLALR